MKKFKKAVFILLVIASLGVFIIWGMNLAGGAFPEGIFVGSQETSLPIFHLVAEFLMAVEQECKLRNCPYSLINYVDLNQDVSMIGGV